MDVPTKGPIESLVFVTASLIDLMTREIELLKNMQPQEIRDLQQQKADLARAYEACIDRIKAEPQLLAAAGKPVKRELKELTGKFQAVLVDNERALRAVKSVSERLYSADIDRAISRFDHFEKKIELMESEIEANGLGRKGSSIEAEFIRLETEGKVDEELAALKARLEKKNRGAE